MESKKNKIKKQTNKNRLTEIETKGMVTRKEGRKEEQAKKGRKERKEREREGKYGREKRRMEEGRERKEEGERGGREERRKDGLVITPGRSRRQPRLCSEAQLRREGLPRDALEVSRPALFPLLLLRRPAHPQGAPCICSALACTISRERGHHSGTKAPHGNDPCISHSPLDDI